MGGIFCTNDENTETPNTDLDKVQTTRWSSMREACLWKLKNNRIWKAQLLQSLRLAQHIDCFIIELPFEKSHQIGESNEDHDMCAHIV